jgi:glycine oxidase
VKGQIMRLRDPGGPGLLERVVRFEGGYLVPRGDGRYVLGATMEERGFQADLTAGGIYELLRDAHELVPGVSELHVEELGVGFRPGTPDNVPAIGPGTLAGLTWATGHHRNGILLAPLTAELVARRLAGEAPRAADGIVESAGTPAHPPAAPGSSFVALPAQLADTCDPRRFAQSPLVGAGAPR